MEIAKSNIVRSDAGRDRGKLLVLLCTYFWGPFLQIYISMVCGNGKEKTKTLDEKNTIRNLY